MHTTSTPAAVKGRWLSCPAACLCHTSRKNHAVTYQIPAPAALVLLAWRNARLMRCGDAPGPAADPLPPFPLALLAPPMSDPTEPFDDMPELVCTLLRVRSVGVTERPSPIESLDGVTPPSPDADADADADADTPANASGTEGVRYMPAVGDDDLRGALLGGDANIAENALMSNRPTSWFPPAIFGDVVVEVATPGDPAGATPPAAADGDA